MKPGSGANLADVGLLRKLMMLLDPTERRAAFMLLGLMLMGMVLEMCGVGLMVPALMLFMEGDVAQTHPQFRPVLEWLGSPTQAELILGGVLVMFVVYLIRTLFLTFLAWRQATFAYGMQEELSQRLYTGYLHQPYTFHLQRNSAQLIHAITEVGQFTFYGIMPGMLLITEAMVVVGIALLLLIIEPIGALSVGGVLGGAGWAMQRALRTRLHKWGNMRRVHEGQGLQQLQQGLGGVKDVKLLGREREFLDQHHVHVIGAARAGRLHMTLQQFPRLWIELLGVAGLAILIVTMLAQGYPMSSIVAILGLFAFASFRLMPSVSRMVAASQTLQYGLPVVDTLLKELQQFVPPTPRAAGDLPPFEHEIVMENVHFSYPGAATPALQGVSIRIARGESVGIVGASGSGKSTLVDVLLGLLTPDAGAVLVDRRNTQQHMRGWQDQIGYVSQSIYLTDDTLRRNVAFGVPEDQIDDDAVMRAITAAQLETFVAEHPDKLNMMVGERGARLSGGQRQRIGIARALYHDPAVLVLDEATSALDTTTEEGVMRAVEALHGSKTLIIIAHRLTTIANCDRIYRIEDGRVSQQGAYNEVITS